MIGEDFLFNNKWLSFYDMKMYSPEDAQTFVSRAIDKGNQSPIRSTPNHYSAHYSDVLVFNYLIFKNEDICDTQRDYVLSDEEINELRAWLESPKLPCELFLQDENNEGNTYYFGVFTEVRPYILNDECYGLYLTFTCNAPYGFSAPIIRKIKIDGADREINVLFQNDSAELNEYMKPTITINSNSSFVGGEIFEIKNTADSDKKMSFKFSEIFSNKLSGTNKVVIDCQKKTITDNLGRSIPLSAVDLGFKETNYNALFSALSGDLYWLRFPHGTNKLVVTTKDTDSVSTIEISGRYIKKAGGF